MTYPDFTKRFILATDASDWGIGAVLSQKDKENLEHPIAYASHLPNKIILCSKKNA